MLNRSVVLGFLLISSVSFAEETTQVVVIVGPSTHKPGTHEVKAGGRLMAWCVENTTNVDHVRARVFYDWPNLQTLQSADTIVFIGDRFPASRFGDATRQLAELDGVLRSGTGIVCVHYAVGLWKDDLEPNGNHRLLDWLGGYFANKSCPHHQSIARVFKEATIDPSDNTHPVLNGWEAFTLHDEPYINNYFGPNQNRMAANVTPLATSMLPPEAPKREIVSWCVERPGGGRGFAIVMPHFYKNWKNDDLRTFIMNGIVWTARREVPNNGVQTVLPSLSKFEPESIEFVPVKKKN